MCFRATEPGKGLTTSWKDDESSLDDDEIKQNEAALDSAIREEELIEEELLQVEKDFEEVYFLFISELKMTILEYLIVNYKFPICCCLD